VIGSKAKVMKDHGEFLESKLGRPAVPTLHPSAVLRAEDEDRADALAMLVGDLTRVRKHLDGR
jgi:uracil-DNA glycosylase